MNNENIIKRAELHFHTKFSKNHHSSIEVSKAIEKAKELNLSSIAFCDYKSVDAFTDITNIKNENKSDIKIIYGVEGYLLDDTGVDADNFNIKDYFLI